MELGVLGLFIAVLILCLATGFSIVYALLFGFVLFFLFGLLKGSQAKVLFKASLESVKKVSTIIIVMLLIGALTASWRASGTIALLVSYASEVVTPQVCLFSTFLLNAFLSTLIGTSFGTAATMGVVTMTMWCLHGRFSFMGGRRGPCRSLYRRQMFSRVDKRSAGLFGDVDGLV